MFQVTNDTELRSAKAQDLQIKSRRRACRLPRRRHGATVLLTSHNMVEVERLCDLIVVMRYGRIVEQGSVGELKHRYGGSSLDETLMRI
jgi:ABC-type multidrug transport system ATPase subunit